MRQIALALAALALAGSAQAQSSYTCSVSELQFEGTSDQSWIDGNMAKIFTIEPMGDRVRLSTRSPRFDPTQTELILVSDQGMSAVAATMFGHRDGRAGYPASARPAVEGPFEGDLVRVIIRKLRSIPRVLGLHRAGASSRRPPRRGRGPESAWAQTCRGSPIDRWDRPGGRALWRNG